MADEKTQPLPSTPAEEKPQPQPVQEAGTAIVEGEVETGGIPADGNNIASTFDRATADTPPANDQPPVEKTFVAPKDNP